ncbi:MAG: acyl-CoA dehydrogenase family protein [Polyangiaceae bacterium]|nr:acyl-CoA dehydrogenase family protein [Polyangiaceae bacterium]
MAARPHDIFNPTEEHRQLRDTVRRFGDTEVEPQAAAHDEAESFNQELFKRFGEELGIFGLTVAADDGGGGLDATASVLVHEELSRFDPGLTLSFLAHEVLFVNNFYHSANPAQRDRYLGKVLSGEWIGGMAMTEAGAGTDVLSMRTKAVRKGDRYVLNGDKQFITNGPNGQIFLVYAKTGESKRDISSFVVESSFKGFSVGKKESKMGMRASPTSCLVFEDMEVPVENRLGEQGGALVHMMRNLEIERLTLASQSIGIALRCCEVMSRYAIQERAAFGKKLIEFGQIQRMIAESHAQTMAARALVYTVAQAVDPERRESLGAASAKLMATGIGETVARNAIQVLGGYGYTRDYPVERLMRDAILLSIGGGTSEAMQKNIASDLTRLYA